MLHEIPRTLFIDDDDGFLKLMRLVFKNKALTAHSADSGLKMASDSPPQVIVLDIAMPEKDGFYVLDQLKRDPQLAQIPVLVLTAWVAPQSLDQLTLQGVPYLTKPVSMDKLGKTISQYARIQ